MIRAFGSITPGSLALVRRHSPLQNAVVSHTSAIVQGTTFRDFAKKSQLYKNCLMNNPIANVRVLLPLLTAAAYQGSVYPGCMESLVRYKKLILKRHREKLGDEEGQLKSECLDLLAELSNIDPLRRNRYQQSSKLISLRYFVSH